VPVKEKNPANPGDAGKGKIGKRKLLISRYYKEKATRKCMHILETLWFSGFIPISIEFDRLGNAITASLSTLALTVAGQSPLQTVNTG